LLPGLPNIRVQFTFVLPEVRSVVTYPRQSVVVTASAPGLPTPAPTVSQLLDDAPRSRFHRRAVVVSGGGVVTDAYDLFVISTVAVLVQSQWNLSTTQVSWVQGTAILGAFIGAIVFGRVADLAGRKRAYGLVAAIMIVGAVASAVAPGFWWLVVSRFVLGVGIGGDYPVSAVLMSEYANRKDRGRLVGMVFSMQAVGLVVGPVVAMALLGGGVSHQLTWRLLLGLGAVPAAAVLYLRMKMPESPRYQAQVHGTHERAITELASYSDGVIGKAAVRSEQTARRPLGDLVTDRRLLRLVVATAGSWFLFDYAYYGNTLSLPAILKAVDTTASLTTKLALTLALFAGFAVPGYLLAVARMDRIGHRRLQLVGFGVMAAAFLALATIGPLTSVMGLFIAVFGLSYFFVEFGPNTTTFVIPSEVFPTRLRSTGHGIAAGVGKLGAFVGVFAVPRLQSAIGLRGMLGVAAGAAAIGFLLTRVLPEAGNRTLDEVSQGEEQRDSQGADQAPMSDAQAPASEPVAV
jgi:PHS family inorganic phosphate transporter-like MFS transporter